MKHSSVVFALSLSLVSAQAAAAEKLEVVSSLPTYAALVQEVGGDLVTTSSIGGARFNPHFIEPRPSDVLRLKRADLFVHSGLDLEAWRGPLVNATGRAEVKPGGERELDLSRGIHLLNVPRGAVSRSEGDIHLFGNPHYWLSPENGLIIADEIAEKLAELDPEHAALYLGNRDRFRARLAGRIEQWKQQSRALTGAEFIGYHDQWIYLMEFLGFTMEKFLEPKPGIPPTPRHLLLLQQYTASSPVVGIVHATFYPDDAARALGERSGLPVLALPQNVGEIPEAADYISLLEYDISRLIGAAQRGRSHE
ncbi:MAG: zinc ABC transporter substrate-binding protein [Bdellovibrionales bacterium]|nr:zinc ABC transporter substrate-binding protein [Bdellovibrionales bacterium]